MIVSTSYVADPPIHVSTGGCTVHRVRIPRRGRALEVYSPAGDRIPYQYGVMISYEDRYITIEVLTSPISYGVCRYDGDTLILPTGEHIICQRIEIVRDSPGYLPMIRCTIDI